jgi:hypothetical protein
VLQTSILPAGGRRCLLQNRCPSTAQKHDVSSTGSINEIKLTTNTNTRNLEDAN